MDILKKFQKSLALLALFGNSVSIVLSLVVFYVLSDALSMSATTSALTAAVVWLVSISLFSAKLVDSATKPTVSMYKALDHIAAVPSEQAPPSAEASGMSKDVVTHVLEDVYKLSTGQNSAQTELSSEKEFLETLINIQSNALIAIDRNEQIRYVSRAATEVIPVSAENPIGMQIDELIDFEFSSGVPLKDWLQTVQAEKIQDRHFWQRVRINQGETVRYYDLIADYTKNESHGIETVLGLVDRTEDYSQDENAIGFASMAVHELRAPVTLLRGYIELFQDEIGSKLDAEQAQFMNKMSVAASQLSSFMNNILNVAKADNDEFKVHIHEESINEVISQSSGELSLRAQVTNRSIELQLAENLPTVGIDKVSMYEVLSNLVDNAIKYSKLNGKVIIKTEMNQEGLVQVSIQDFGVGIPASAMDNLFERFYRSHHSKNNVSGTGLGLYLSKTIVEAHDGTMWMKSEEGQGSTFGFNLPSFESIKDQVSQDGTGEIMRSAHGWIKNHGRVRH